MTGAPLRILAVTNRIPPDDRGGYALGCLRTVEALEGRGHNLRLLTSSPRPGQGGGDARVLAQLARDRELSPSWQAAFLKELVNQSSFRTACRDFRPDAVLAFDLTGVSVSLACLAGDFGLPLIIFVASDWLATWERDIWYRAWPKVDAGFKVLRFLSRRFGLRPVSDPLASSRVIFASRHLEAMARQVGKTWARGDVVPWGIDTARFSPRDPAGTPRGRLLYVGRIWQEKGIDVLVRALGLINRENGADSLSLTIAGDERPSQGYTAYLRELASSCGVSHNVTFAGFVPPSDMPDLYRAHDVFVFPSAVVEPLSLPVLEAMACGLGVVSTATGGNAEFLEDEINALVIPAENADRCAAQVLRLAQDPGLLVSLGSRARRTVENNYSLAAATTSLENILSEETQLARRTRPAPAAADRPADINGAPSASLDKLVAKAGRWLSWGGLVVLARNILRPEKFVKAFRRAVRATSAFVSLLLFPAVLEPFFRIAGRRRRSTAPGPRSSPKSVLVVQLADLGDVILTSPFLRELRRQVPRARITLVVQPGLVNIVERCPYIDEIIPYDWRTIRDWMTAFRGAPGWWRSSLRIARRRLWKRRIDLAVSLRRNNDPCQSAALILMYVSGAARRVAYIDRPGDPKLRSPRFVDRLVTEGPYRGALRHEVEYQMEILRSLGARPENTCLETWTDAADESFAREALARPQFAKDGPLVALAPGARWSYRRWPADRFSELSAWLQDEFRARIVILAGKSEMPLAGIIEQRLSKPRTVNLAGRTTLRQMAAVFKRCDVFIGIDSGPMHVATAAGVPSVGLFGTGEYERFRPWGEAHEVIRIGLTCNPCSESCLFGRPLCIEGITLDQAKKVMSRKLAGILK
jgi:ADP-heptose:LPS heptosyltransferase/glycosyltransferase involved in cell wall biosynthesis